MIARAFHRLRERAVAPRHLRGARDSGLTLVELIIAMTLTLILSGVLVSAIITSLRVASATSDNLKSSVDIRLVSSYLARDAQGAGGTDPNTVQKSAKSGVSNTPGDWGGCERAGATMVVRFSWVDHVDIRTQHDITVTWSISGSDLYRQYCEDGVVKYNLRLGRTLTSAVASCDTTCSAAPTSVSLTVSGNNGDRNYSTTMSASLRPRGQDFPTTDSASTVTFLALGHGSPTPCTNVALGTATAYVIGDAVVNVNDDSCDADALTPSTDSIVHPAFASPAVTGVTSLTASLVDPLAATPAPSATCSGGNPALGTPGVYPNKLTVKADDGAVVFASGTYVFCNGLEIQAGASVVSDGGVLLYLKGGTLTIDPAASVELSAITSGIDQRHILVWVASKQTVRIGTGAHITRLGGTIYAPTSDVIFTGDTDAAAINVGVLIAATVTVNTEVPIVRFGPIPTLSITPSLLVDALAGEPYEAQLSLAGDGAAQMVNAQWSATGLSPFVIDPDTGLISGTADCAVALTPSVRVVDATGLAVSANYTLRVGSDLSLADPGPYVRDTVILKASLVDTCNAEGTSVTIQYALSGEDEDGDGEPDWQDMCTSTTVVDGTYQCAWDTLDTGKYTDGASYDLRALATLPNGTSSTSESIESVTIDNTAPLLDLFVPTTSPLHGLVELVADAVDGETGIKKVVFEVSPAGLDLWTTVCTKTVPYDPANQSQYLCEWDTVEFVPAYIGTVKWDIRAAAVDLAGNWSSYDKVSGRSINNSGASVGILNPGSYIKGTVSIDTTHVVPSPATVTSITIEYKKKGSSWTELCVITAAPWSCDWDTTGVDDDEYDLRATMVDSRPVTVTSDTVTTNVDNSDFYAKDVQANNGNWQKKAADRTHPTTWFKEKFGKINGIDILTLKYSKEVDPNSIIPGWSGATRSIYIRIIDGQFLDVKANTIAKVLDLLDFCTSWSSNGMNCSGSGSSSNPRIGEGTGLGYIQLNSDFVDGWDNDANKRKAAILFGKISVSGSTVTVRIGDPCPADKWYPWDGGYVCTKGDAKTTNPNSPKDSKTPNKRATMVWIPYTDGASLRAAADDVFSTLVSTRPGPESGSLDRDF